MDNDKRYNTDMLDKIRQNGILRDQRSRPYEEGVKKKQKTNYSGPLKVKKK